MLVLVPMLLLSSNVSAQTQEELQAQLLAKAAEMRTICKQLTGDVPGSKCYILTEFVEKEVIVEVPGECLDPLEASRLNVEQAVVNVVETQKAILSMRQWFDNLSTRELEQVKQSLDQLLLDNPQL